MRPLSRCSEGFNYEDLYYHYNNKSVLYYLNSCGYKNVSAMISYNETRNEENFKLFLEKLSKVIILEDYLRLIDGSLNDQR